jgi:hypothetical protein
MRDKTVIAGVGTTAVAPSTRTPDPKHGPSELITVPLLQVAIFHALAYPDSIYINQ